MFGITPKELGNETYFDSSTTDEKPAASPSLLALAAELWDGVAQLNTELLSLMPVIFAPTSQKSAALSVSFSGSNTTDTPVRAMWKVLPDGSEYLIAVNVDVRRVPSSIRIRICTSLLIDLTATSSVWWLVAH